MLHPVVCNPVLNPLVDVANVVGWRAGSSYPAAAIRWRDTVNAKPLRYVTYNGKYLVVKNV